MPGGDHTGRESFDLNYYTYRVDILGVRANHAGSQGRPCRPGDTDGTTFEHFLSWTTPPPSPAVAGDTSRLLDWEAGSAAKQADSIEEAAPSPRLRPRRAEAEGTRHRPPILRHLTDTRPDRRPGCPRRDATWGVANQTCL